MCTIRPVEECHTVPRPVTEQVSIPAEEPKCQNVVEVQAVSCGAGLVNHRIAQREADAKPEADAFYGAKYTAGAASETEMVTLKNSLILCL